MADPGSEDDAQEHVTSNGHCRLLTLSPLRSLHRSRQLETLAPTDRVGTKVGAGVLEVQVTQTCFLAMKLGQLFRRTATPIARLWSRTDILHACKVPRQPVLCLCTTFNRGPV